MSAKIIDGKQIAAQIRQELAAEVSELKTKGISPGLATLLVGEDSASQVYVRSKHKACQDTGIVSFNHTLPQNTDTAQVLAKVHALNDDPAVHGILVQLPLPPQVDSKAVLTAIRPSKDVDGFHPQNLGALFSAKDISELENGPDPVPVPCTPRGVIALIKSTGLSMSGKNAVVLGRSVIVGKPAAVLLLAHHATVTIVHSRTQNLVEYCSKADILVAAIGKAKMVKADMVHEGAVVIDVGINRLPDGKLCGDVDFDSVKEKAGWITPVPGGVGPMTIVMLLKNTVQLARSSAGIRK